ncbi:Galactokinase [Panus rudis PR-1116 ss-1]|nr:Galactokinase [Panus rudis PR-1116 ss-1]
MAAQLPIPVITALSEAYPDLAVATKQAARFNELVAHFESSFGDKPQFIARAPGRVNLLGEHIDYALFGVFPAAIEQDILIACGPRKSGSDQPGSVLAHNTAPKYGPQEFAPMLRVVGKGTQEVRAKQDKEVEESVSVQDWHLDIDKTQLRWESYVKAGYYGVLNHFFAKGNDHPVPVNILVSGNVPAGSGLSSSAAMVVGSTLAFLAVNKKVNEVTKGGLVEMAVENEKRVGVNSGGMDQAASILCSPNSALYISFYPSLSAELISIPQPPPGQEGVALVVANSLVVSDKVVGARTRYNLRVVETLSAARVLSHKLNLGLGVKDGKNGSPPTLREVLSRYVGSEKEPLGPEQLKIALEKILGEIDVLKSRDTKEGEEDQGVTFDELVHLSGLSREEFEKAYLSWIDVEAQRFKLYHRAKHVFEEALRVLEFRETCLASTSQSTTSTELPTSTYEKLGKLMDASHESCSKVYQCSCPELDELVQIQREAGAYGSRQTGAGWGGCSVSLVPESKVEEFIEKVKSRYPKYQGLEEAKLREAIFATKPGIGAFVYQLTA